MLKSNLNYEQTKSVWSIESISGLPALGQFYDRCVVLGFDRRFHSYACIHNLIFQLPIVLFSSNKHILVVRKSS